MTTDTSTAQNCPSVSTLAAFAEGLTDESQNRQLAHHFECCRACTKLVALHLALCTKTTPVPSNCPITYKVSIPNAAERRLCSRGVKKALTQNGFTKVTEDNSSSPTLRDKLLDQLNKVKAAANSLSHPSRLPSACLGKRRSRLEETPTSNNDLTDSTPDSETAE